MTQLLDGLPENHFGVVLADPPWHWKPWSEVADDDRKRLGPLHGRFATLMRFKEKKANG